MKPCQELRARGSGKGEDQVRQSGNLGPYNTAWSRDTEFAAVGGGASLAQSVGLKGAGRVGECQAAFVVVSSERG